MKTFFDEPDQDELLKIRISYREYKNPTRDEGYHSIKNTYDEKTKTIEVETFPFIEKWEMTFKNEIFDVYVNKYYYKTDWVSDVYIQTDREDVMQRMQRQVVRILARKKTYTKEFLKKINKNNEFEKVFNLKFIEKISKKDVNLQEYKELLSRAHWKDDMLSCFR